LSSRKRLARLGIAIPEILIPRAGIALEEWSVIACDQFSSDLSYWERTRELVGESPSTLNMIIPECYLNDGNEEERVRKANAAMVDYIENGVLETLSPGFLLVHRSTPHTARREGLVLALDLESYDFAEDSQSAIRPTEGTIRDRLPPRMAVRREALLDLPHILVLIDDPEHRVMRAAEAAALAAGGKLYDFDLMQGGGHIHGRHLPEAALDSVAAAFEYLADRSDLLFAVGDGNHSLASAREIWQEKKRAGFPEHHPARYALVEVENVHDAGLHFHPIHRVLFNVDASDLAEYLKRELQFGTSDDAGGGCFLMVKHDGNQTSCSIPLTPGKLVAEPLQAALDAYLEAHPDAEIDYIHGEDAARELTGAARDRLGLILPEIRKSSFFRRIREVGPYPRKTFSIGEAVEKRYYLEARKLGF